MAIALEKLTSLEAEISDVVAELYETFSAAEVLEDTLACERALDRYMNRVARIGMLACGAGLGGVHESCVFFHQILKELKRREGVLTSGERDLLEQWPLLVSTCLVTPFSAEVAETLLDYLRNDLWPCSLPEQVVDDVYADCESGVETVATPADSETGESPLELVTADTSQGSASAANEASPMPGEPPPSTLEHAQDRCQQAGSASTDDQPVTAHLDADWLDVMQQEVVEAIDALFDDLAAVSADAPADALASAFDLCADRMELMVMSAAEAGLAGFVDACALFQANLRALGQRHTGLSADESETLARWPLLTANYFRQPTDPEAAAALVDYLKTFPAAAVLPADEAADVCDSLQGGAVDPTPAAFPEECAEEAGTVDSVPAETVWDMEPDMGGDAEETLSEAASELVQLVKMELQSATASLSEALAGLTVAGEPSARAQSLETYLELVDRFRIASESMGLNGLRRVLDQIHDNVFALASRERPPDDEERAHLEQWPELILAYLDSLSNGSGNLQLIEYLQSPHWPLAFTDEDLSEVLAMLESPEFITEDEVGEPRQTQAQAEDVSLELPQDINAQLIDSLLQELPSQSAEFTNAISRIVDGNGTLQDVDIAQRIAHTLKGSANTVGVAGVANLTHHIEDILLAFAKHERLPGGELADVLLGAADVLEMMSEALLGMGPMPEQALATLQKVLDWANRIDRDGVPQHDDGAVVPESAAAPVDNSDTAEPPANNESASMLRVPAALVDDLLRLVGESIILTGQLQNRLHQAEAQTESVREQHSLFQQLTAELEHLVETQGLTAGHAGESPQQEFDALEMERYNELHTVTHRLVEAATDARELTAGIEDHLTTLDDLLADQRKLQKDKQDLVMRTRMVPVQTVVPRLQRVVRQAGRQTGKQVSLEVRGADTLIDSQVLTELIDPLTHLLRNAVDHGIETPERRAGLGKPEGGQIEVQFHREGDHICVACRDDGAGLDLETIRATAEARGLVTPGRELSEEELTWLVLVPGFSTRSETSQVSGRGIGMDAVHSRVLQLKGTLNIESERDQGCTVELRLPLTLISVHALLVRDGGAGVAVSSRGVDQILYPGAGVLTRDGKTLRFGFDQHDYEAWHLETLLEMPVPEDAEQSADRPVLLVRDETSTVRAVCVGQIRATQDMVVKQMGPFVPSIWGVEGTTILGDGSVAPLVDLPMLLRTATHDAVVWTRDRSAGFGGSETRPCALVVDDSLSARRSLAEFLQDLGYEVRTARDGLEAIEVMDERLPTIVLVDLEMPRMNGLELAAHVRAQKSTKHIPMIMITSRSTEKHRQKAQAAGVNAYLTKPFSEDELIDQIQVALTPCEASCE